MSSLIWAPSARRSFSLSLTFSSSRSLQILALGFSPSFWSGARKALRSSPWKSWVSFFLHEPRSFCSQVVHQFTLWDCEGRHRLASESQLLPYNHRPVYRLLTYLALMTRWKRKANHIHVQTPMPGHSMRLACTHANPDRVKNYCAYGAPPIIWGREWRNRD